MPSTLLAESETRSEIITHPHPEITSERLNPADWITKIQAASTIGVVLKTVEQLAKKGQLRQATWRRSTGPALVVYHAADVATVAANWPKRRTRATLVTPGDAPALHAPPSPETTALAVAAAEAGRREIVVISASESRKPFLTLQEAAALSGLTVRDLRQTIRRGELPCRHKERRDSRAWRIHRDHLETLGE